MWTRSAWPWACSTDRRRARRAWRAAVLGALLVGSAARAKTLLTQEQALEKAFGPSAAVARETAYLGADQLGRARELAGPDVEIDSALLVRYVATRDGRRVGTAYFDTHVVRTLPETVMVIVAPDSRIARTEVLSFGEPAEYLPRERWFAQFPDRSLDADLAVKRGIHGITGATLSARAFTRAARRILALHQVVEQAAATPGEKP